MRVPCGTAQRCRCGNLRAAMARDGCVSGEFQICSRVQAVAILSGGGWNEGGCTHPTRTIIREWRSNEEMAAAAAAGLRFGRGGSMDRSRAASILVRIQYEHKSESRELGVEFTCCWRDKETIICRR
ncbi:hypothetical protein OROMI_017196 [Orobanche minor]